MPKQADMDIKVKGHVVEDFYLGNTRIIICDDYCRDKTIEDAQETMRRMARIVLRGYRKQQLKELERNGK